MGPVLRWGQCGDEDSAVTRAVLVINAGSSSIRFAMFGAGLAPGLRGSVTGIGGEARFEIAGAGAGVAAPDHATALRLVLQALAGRGIALEGLRAAGHRVVHGGDRLTEPSRIDVNVLAGIEACAALAPLHNPHNLAAIRALGALAPGLPQTASFDTAFHAGNPAVATRFALPDGAATRGLRRYGFHGLSYASLTEALPRISGAALPHRLLAFHLGNGASACAIVNGRSVCTTMGYSPLDGLTMGTRPGSLDANAVLTMADRIGTSATRDLLNRESGLRGLSGGISDMRELLKDDSATSRFAVAHFCYWAVRHAGSLIAAMGGVDAVAFTGGIGEHAAPVRARIMDGLSWLGLVPDPAANAVNLPRLHVAGSPVQGWIVPAAEERQIARDALTLLGG